MMLSSKVAAGMAARVCGGRRAACWVGRRSSRSVRPPRATRQHDRRTANGGSRWAAPEALVDDVWPGRRDGGAVSGARALLVERISKRCREYDRRDIGADCAETRGRSSNGAAVGGRSGAQQQAEQDQKRPERSHANPATGRRPLHRNVGAIGSSSWNHRTTPIALVSYRSSRARARRANRSASRMRASGKSTDQVAPP